MPQPNDLSRSLVALDQNSTIIAVIEMSQSSWLVAGMLPGIERQPRKKLEPSAERLLALLQRWQDEAVKAGRTITRIALAFEAGRDGFWLARWLEARGFEAHVIHASSIAVSREHRRAKTDRLDTELLKRGFLGWLRGERGHCSMARVPTIAEEDAKRPNRERECLVRERTRIVNRIKSTLARLGVRNFKPTLRKAANVWPPFTPRRACHCHQTPWPSLQRDMARLGFVVSQIREIEDARQKRLEQEPETGPHAMVRQLARNHDWKTGGGSAWMTGNYDPALNLVYWGVGNAAPWPGDLHPGDNLYTTSVLALDPDTGKIKAYHQYHPNDSGTGTKSRRLC